MKRPRNTLLVEAPLVHSMLVPFAQAHADADALSHMVLLLESATTPPFNFVYKKKPQQTSTTLSMPKSLFSNLEPICQDAAGQ